MMKKYISLSIILLIALASVLGIYWKVFHGEFSNNSTDWGNFGGYFNGLLTPILTIINIFVFVGISMKLSMLDDKRAERESQGQKDLLLMQFRKKEIDNFERIMNDALIPSSQFVISKEALARPIVCADLYIHTFLKSKLTLFNLEESSEIAQSIGELKMELNLFHTKFISDKEIGGKDTIRILELHSCIIRHLQDITLNK